MSQDNDMALYTVGFKIYVYLCFTISQTLGIPFMMRMGMKNVSPVLTFSISEDNFSMVAKTPFRLVGYSYRIT